MYCTHRASNFLEDMRAHKGQFVLQITQYEIIIRTPQFFATWKRPDISSAVCILSQHSAKPTMYLSRCVNHVFGYLKKTKSFWFEYKRKENQLVLNFHCDSNYAGDTTVRKSRTCWIGMINENEFTWRSKKKTGASPSTSEAECTVELEHNIVR